MLRQNNLTLNKSNDKHDYHKNPNFIENRDKRLKSKLKNFGGAKIRLLAN